MVAYFFHSRGAEPIDGAEIRSLSTSNPHEHNILTNSLRDLTRGVNSLGICVDDDFRKHLRMVTVSPATWIGC